ncbi:type II toxin-antitoxin system VapC family toxin [Rhodopseudomonas palustris]|uniref:type II toxin-antitoxin system VapC family toxin n=1 Tax=Rhodopseudomonas palustris TaxID=1076 RepID=UPI0020CF03C2|nr:type II toxin-antitoxin system VapC family toxin [Rhodopseudomonas palustris]MCP9630565.1 type II toxin-antitoxin system VapC family toxin [Rhodopseudomonas palustris]
MRFVLDASVAAAYCFDDEDEPVADAAFARLQGSATAVAPALFWFELRNTLLVGSRRGRIDNQQIKRVLERINRAAITFDRLPSSSNALFELAQRHRLTFYDAAYLELAQREGIELATLDAALIRAAAAEGVTLVGA